MQYEGLTDQSEAVLSSITLAVDAMHDEPDDLFEVITRHLKQGTSSLEESRSYVRRQTIVEGFALHEVGTPLDGVRPFNAKGQRRQAFLCKLSDRAAKRVEVCDMTLRLSHQLLATDELEARLDAIAAQRAERLDALAREAQERQARAESLRRAEEARIERARSEARTRAEAISRERRRRGYWINPDGTVDLATSIERDDDYQPQFDDVQGDYWGGLGLPGPRDMGMADPDDPTP
jgi:hypothetical protein